MPAAFGLRRRKKKKTITGYGPTLHCVSLMFESWWVPVGRKGDTNAITCGRVGDWHIKVQHPQTYCPILRRAALHLCVHTW